MPLLCSSDTMSQSFTSKYLGTSCCTEIHKTDIKPLFPLYQTGPAKPNGSQWGKNLTLPLKSLRCQKQRFHHTRTQGGQETCVTNQGNIHHTGTVPLANTKADSALFDIYCKYFQRQPSTNLGVLSNTEFTGIQK